MCVSSCAGNMWNLEVNNVGCLSYMWSLGLLLNPKLAVSASVVAGLLQEVPSLSTVFWDYR